MSSYELLHGNPGRVLGNLTPEQVEVFHDIRRKQMRKHGATTIANDSRLLREAYEQASRG